MNSSPTPILRLGVRILAVVLLACAFLVLMNRVGQESRRAEEAESRADFLAGRVNQLYAQIDASDAQSAADKQYIHSLEGKLNAYEKREAVSPVYFRAILGNQPLHRANSGVHTR